MLTAEFSITGTVGPIEANKVLLHTQHYDVIAAGVLLSASDDIDEGKLVLSHIVCDEDTTTSSVSDSSTSSSVSDSSTSSSKSDGSTTTSDENHHRQARESKRRLRLSKG